MIPPAYSHNIQVSKDKDADVWATMETKEGETKRVYNPAFEKANEAVKWSRVDRGVSELGGIRSQIQDDRNQGKNLEEADATWLMSMQATRPGSETDTKGNKSLWAQPMTKENVVITPAKDAKKKPGVTLQFGYTKIPIRDDGARDEIINRVKSGGQLHDAGYWIKSHGATTLEGRHVIPDGDGVRLQFMGKEGVWHDHKIADPNLAKMLLDRKSKAGDTGKLFDTNYAKVGQYTGGLASKIYSAKDMRTIRANEMASEAVGSKPRIFESEDERKQFIKSVAEKVSGVLGNRPQQALESYINPATFDGLKVRM